MGPRRRGQQPTAHEGTTWAYNWCCSLLLIVGGFWLGYMHSHALLGHPSGSQAGFDTPLKDSELEFPGIPRPNNISDTRAPQPSSSWTHLVPGDFEELLPDCAKPPTKSYPRKVSIQDIVANWNPDNTTPPTRMYRTICQFDYQKEFHMALIYRNAEVPFQLYNVPEMEEVVHKWSDDSYLRRRLGRVTKYKCEASNPGGEVNHGANHFMYTNGQSTSKPPPIKHVRLTWDEWLRKVDDGEKLPVDTPDSRFYFRFSASSPSDSQAGWLFKELPFFQPKPSIFLREPQGQRGIHCRFGMAGVIAEAHWDGSRNMIGQFYGRRRYILVDPDDSCDMYLLAKNHPSGRHSEVDWSKPDTWEEYPRFPKMPAHEVVQTPGTFLYLPTYYLHYIVSLDRNYQCNSRSGRDDRQTSIVNKCTPGFSPSAGRRAKARQREKPRRGSKPPFLHI